LAADDVSSGLAVCPVLEMQLLSLRLAFPMHIALCDDNTTDFDTVKLAVHARFSIHCCNNYNLLILSILLLCIVTG
jgi:hypothetical protein